MTNLPIAKSELIINDDGSIYHLKLKPEHIADDIIVVGDQGRVNKISQFFDKIEYKIANREFVTHTGWYNGKRITALSTGIGTDNIDIVLNELDALVNIDFETRLVREQKKSLNIIRLGTSGALHPEIPVDSFLVSEYGFGLDNLMHYYDYKLSENEYNITQSFIDNIDWKIASSPYFVEGNKNLISRLSIGLLNGITATAPGFYGPQGRNLRLKPKQDNLNELFRNFEFDNLKITNYEMETSALYGLSKLLGHNACTVCAIIANRYKKEYSRDYQKTIGNLIEIVLQRLTKD